MLQSMFYIILQSSVLDLVICLVVCCARGVFGVNISKCGVTFAVQLGYIVLCLSSVSAMKPVLHVYVPVVRVSDFSMAT